jgi:hypothetical protein
VKDAVREHPAHRRLYFPELATGLPRQILAWFKSRFQSRVAGVGDRRATPPGPWPVLWGLVPAPRDSTPATHRPELATRLPRPIPEPSSPRSTTVKSNARPLVAGVGCPSTHLDPRRSAQQTMSRDIQPKDRQVRRVYKRSNFAGKPPFLAIFGDAPRAFQMAIRVHHVVAVP